MNILILGAGQVGFSLARLLSGEDNDVTVVDQNRDVLRDLRDRYDLRTVVGHCSHPDVLAQAGVADTDMVIAVTNSDEINMVACQVAHTLFNTPKKIARVRETSYLEYSERLFKQEATPIDVLISPEELVTRHIARLIRNPGAKQVFTFANGKIRLVSVRAFLGGKLVNHELRELPEHMPGLKEQARVAAIFRKDKDEEYAILPDGDTVIEPNDEVFFIAAPKHIRAITSELRKLDKVNKRVMIAGGGNIGMRLAMILEKDFQVKIVEMSEQRCRYLAENLHNTVVLHADAADDDVMMEENIDSIDVFIALTNDDEANILSAMLAKRRGADKVMSLVNRPSYAGLVEEGIGIIPISPQQITIGALLTHVRRGDVVTVHSLRRGAAEALEAIAHGDKENSRVVGRRMDELDLPSGVRIAALVRNDDVLMAHHDTMIEAEDHVIIMVTDKTKIDEVEKLFQVKPTFL